MDPFHIVINVVILFIFLMLLDRSSYAVITGAYDISRSTRVRYSSIGFIFVALSTSLPEASVSLFAAIENEAGLAIGNVFGSNIANVCLIVGIPILYGCLSKTEISECRLTLPEHEYPSLFFGLFISSVLPLFMIRSAKYMPIIGVALIAMFIIYSYHLSRSGIDNHPSNGLTHRTKWNLIKGVVWVTVGIAGAILSGYAIVISASNLAAAFSLSGTFVGATIVAVGTSLPELAISLKSIQRNRIDFALSNAIGSCFANLTIILGLFFIFSRITIKIDAYFDLVFFSLISNLFLWYFLSRRKLGPKESIILLIIYAIFLVEFVGIFNPF
ncbi:MAG: sodium:calcium antiporter [Candidatus Bathyarchaeia archaeon]|nr:sodium:calcium antiporter [Candidatus Bathyarchaeota archaeon]